VTVRVLPGVVVGQSCLPHSQLIINSQFGTHTSSRTSILILLLFASEIISAGIQLLLHSHTDRYLPRLISRSTWVSGKPLLTPFALTGLVERAPNGISDHPPEFQLLVSYIWGTPSTKSEPRPQKCANEFKDREPEQKNRGAGTSTGCVRGHEMPSNGINEMHDHSKQSLSFLFQTFCSKCPAN
jgi:hypothetical protein